MKHLLFVVAIAGCSTTPATDIGDVTIGPYVFHVSREGPEPTAGVATQIVIKPTSGGQPTSIEGWAGIASAGEADKVAGKFDPNDGDYDVDLVCPTPMPGGAQLWFDVDTVGVTTIGSIDFK